MQSFVSTLTRAGHNFYVFLSALLAVQVVLDLTSARARPIPHAAKTVLSHASLTCAIVESTRYGRVVHVSSCRKTGVTCATHGTARTETANPKLRPPLAATEQATSVWSCGAKPEPMSRALLGGANEGSERDASVAARSFLLNPEGSSEVKGQCYARTLELRLPKQIFVQDCCRHLGPSTSQSAGRNVEIEEQERPQNQNRRLTLFIFIFLFFEIAKGLRISPLCRVLVHSCIHPTPVGSECLGSSGNDASDPPHIMMLICNIMIGARR